MFVLLVMFVLVVVDMLLLSFRGLGIVVLLLALNIVTVFVSV